jgi:helix-turn-helix protein
VSVARFIADQRTNYRVPVVVCCAILGLSVGWFYKWIKAPVTGQARRRRDLDAAVRSLFEASDRSYGSPRIHRDLVEAGWTVGENTVADSMRRQGLFGRKPKRRRGLTKQDRAGANFPDLVRRTHQRALRRCEQPELHIRPELRPPRHQTACRQRLHRKPNLRPSCPAHQDQVGQGYEDTAPTQLQLRCGRRSNPDRHLRKRPRLEHGPVHLRPLTAGYWSVLRREHEQKDRSHQLCEWETGLHLRRRGESHQ